MNAHDRIVLRLLDALDNPYAWVWIGVVVLALSYILFISCAEPWAGGAL